MANLKTSYMGLELKNPIIVGASNLTADPEKLKRIEKPALRQLFTSRSSRSRSSLKTLKTPSGRRSMRTVMRKW